MLTFISVMKNYQPYIPTYVKLFIIISLLFLFNACSHNYFYTPNTHNNLRLTQAKQIKGEAGIYKSDQTTGVALQTAYSPLKHLGIHANYVNASISPTDRYNPRFKTQKGSLAIGTYYFQKFETKKPDFSYLFEPGFLFDAYAGISVGQNKNWVNESSRFFGSTTSYTPARFNYHTYYFQAGFHFQSFRAVAIGYTFRLFYLDFKKVSAFGKVGNTLTDYIATINKHDPFMLRESSIKLSIGGDKISYYLSINFLSSDRLVEELFFKRSLQTGLEINISSLFRKRESASPVKF